MENRRKGIIKRNTQLQCRYVDNIVIGIYPDRLAVCTKNVLINLK